MASSQLTRTEPLRVMFLLTSMPVGGAETLLVNLVRRMDRNRFAPEITCLKEAGPLGEMLAAEMPVHTQYTSGKFDLRVLPRLVWLMKRRRIDAIVTVGAGDKMFWGRIAARMARVPVIASALHSTGWPDGVGKLNRLLTPLTDAFIGVAKPHGEHLIRHERFPADRVHVIPNGVDTERFAPPVDSTQLRTELGLQETTPLVGILAALRPEKNHEMFLAAAAKVRQEVPDAHFVVIGDGPRRTELELHASQLSMTDSVHFLGNRDDVPDVLAALDVVCLSSHNEANPVSILEAMSTAKPVVATNVGSVHESVDEGHTGHLVPAGDTDAFADRIAALLSNPLLASEMGYRGRAVVEHNWSLDQMVLGYEQLLAEIYQQKTSQRLPITSREKPLPESFEPEAVISELAHS